MWAKQCHEGHEPSPSHHHFYSGYGYTIPSHGWFILIYDIVLPVTMIDIYISILFVFPWLWMSKTYIIITMSTISIYYIITTFAYYNNYQIISIYSPYYTKLHDPKHVNFLGQLSFYIPPFPERKVTSSPPACLTGSQSSQGLGDPWQLPWDLLELMVFFSTGAFHAGNGSEWGCWDYSWLLWILPSFPIWSTSKSSSKV